MHAFLSLKWKKSNKVIGKIKRDQMYKLNSKEWLLPRINPICENCKSNDYYTIDKLFYKIFKVLPYGNSEQVYRIICPNCRETIELDIEEFLDIKPFIKLNTLLYSKKI